MDSLLANLFGAKPTAWGELQTVLLYIIMINFNTITIQVRRMRISRDRRVSLDQFHSITREEGERNGEIQVGLVHVNAVYCPCPPHQSCPAPVVIDRNGEMYTQGGSSAAGPQPNPETPRAHVPAS